MRNVLFSHFFNYSLHITNYSLFLFFYYLGINPVIHEFLCICEGCCFVHLVLVCKSLGSICYGECLACHSIPNNGS